jgi:hypothetical protein
MPYTKASIRYDITVGGVHLGVADAFDGGNKTAEITVYPRASGNKVLTALPKRDTGKATYLYTEEFHAIYQQLDAAVGKGNKKAVIGRAAYGDDGTPFAGAGLPPLTGIITNLGNPPSDPKSADPAEVEIEFALDTEAAG